VCHDCIMIAFGSYSGFREVHVSTTASCQEGDSHEILIGRMNYRWLALSSSIEAFIKDERECATSTLRAGKWSFIKVLDYSGDRNPMYSFGGRHNESKRQLANSLLFHCKSGHSPCHPLPLPFFSCFLQFSP
jgi:hypothetical protein